MSEYVKSSTNERDNETPFPLESKNRPVVAHPCFKAVKCSMDYYKLIINDWSDFIWVNKFQAYLLYKGLASVLKLMYQTMIQICDFGGKALLFWCYKCRYLSLKLSDYVLLSCFLKVSRIKTTKKSLYSLTYRYFS